MRITADTPLLSDHLHALWQNVEDGSLSRDAFAALESEGVEAYRRAWAEALLLPGETSMPPSACRELKEVLGLADSLDAIAARCRGGVKEMKKEWEDRVDRGDEESIVTYYDKSESYPYELLWWHTLAEDLSPLAYVAALHLAIKQPGRAYLDFGAGVGSGGLLFARHGFNVTLADISSSLLGFSKTRLAHRRVDATFLDLKTDALVAGSADIITAMDVFEHLPRPEDTARELARTLRPGGLLFGRFAADEDPARPSHIATDFEPTFAAFEECGLEPFWEDAWLWGHRAFRMTGG